MKRLLLFSLILLPWLGTTMAQSAFPINGMWYKSKHYFTWGGHGQPYIEEITNYIYTINGSVNSGSNTFYKLYNGYQFVAYIKTNEDKTWYGSDTSAMQPMFDYTLQVGDTFLFPYSTGFGGVTKLTVTSIDEVMVDGLMRKRMAFSNFYQYPCGPVWIKGIGDSKFGGLEFDYAYTVWDMNYSELECFKENGQAVFGNCVVGIRHPLDTPTICTFNLLQQNLTVNLRQTKAALLEVYTVTGVKVLETTITKQETSLPFYKFSPGLYIARITQSNGSQTQKFFKP